MSDKIFINNIGFVNHLNQVVQSPSIPGRPSCKLPNTTRLFGRSKVIASLVKRLVESSQPIVVAAVRGLPGVGKTDFVRALGCDPRIVAHFAGGVLYAEIGKIPDVAQILRNWLLELAQEVPKTNDPEALAAVVRRTVAERPTLLILDDIWLESFQVARILRDCATMNCRILVSSRSRDIAEEMTVSPEQVLKLDVLDFNDSLVMLHTYAPRAVTIDYRGATKLVEELGNLPLALKLASRLLRYDNTDQPCSNLLLSWRDRLKDLKGFEYRPNINSEQLSLDAIIAFSYDSLPNDNIRFAANSLAVFGENPLEWTQEAAGVIWNIDHDMTMNWLEILVNSGLVEQNEVNRRYNLHQTIHAFLEKESIEECVKVRHAAFYSNLMNQCNNQIENKKNIYEALDILENEINQIERGQEYAMISKSDEMNEIIVEYANSCNNYFNLRVRYHQWLNWANAAKNVLKKQGRCKEEAKMMSDIGTVYRNIGCYDKSIVAYISANEVFKRLGLFTELIKNYDYIGAIKRLQGNYGEAALFHKKGFELAKKSTTLQVWLINWEV